MNPLVTPILSAVAGVADKTLGLFTRKEEAKKEILQAVESAATAALEAQRAIIEKEATGNFLQRSWRPITMLSFAFIIIYAYFLQPAFFPDAVNVRSELPADFWNLLNLGLGGYVVGRSLEKISANIKK